MKYLTFQIFCFFISIQIVQAQQIDITLPHFAGKEFSFSLPQGLRSDTIVRSILDKDGKATIVIPERYRNYRGMGHFRMVNGGGLDLVVAGESFSVNCMEEQPSINNVHIMNSSENTFVTEQFRKSNELKQKKQLSDAAVLVYTKATLFGRQAIKEQQRLRWQIAKQDSLLQHSTLYAARFLRLQQYLDDVANAYRKTPEEIEVLRQYGVKSLDMEALFTSGLWYHVLDYWTAMYRDYVKEDNAFPEDVVAIMKRIKNQKVFEEFSDDIASICEQNKWNHTEYAIADYLLQSGRADNTTNYRLINLMQTHRVRPGKPAPEIVTGSGSVRADSVRAGSVRAGSKPARNNDNESYPNRAGLEPAPTGTTTLLIFHETDCDHCEREIQQLKQRYLELKQKGIEVISISSDFDQSIFNTGTASFPWTTKLCDFKGPEGINFKNYGVLGTPTIFVIDEKGIITGRYAKLEETKLINNKDYI